MTSLAFKSLLNVTMISLRFSLGPMAAIFFTTLISAPSAMAQATDNAIPVQVAPIAQQINPVTGPSFPCPQPEDPLAQLVCSTPQLALLDMHFVQTFEALYQQLGATGDPTLLRQDTDFDLAVRTKCGISMSQVSKPSVTPPPPAPPGSDDCVLPAYQQQILLWSSVLQGPAAEEARRPIQSQVELQSILQRLGFLPAQATIDGVFGKATRAAITKWQLASGRQATGLLSDDDAKALFRNQPSASAPLTSTPPASVEQAWVPFIPEAECMSQHGFLLQTFVQQGISPSDPIANAVVKSCQASPAPQVVPSNVAPSPSSNVGQPTPPQPTPPPAPPQPVSISVVTEGPLQINITGIEYPNSVGNAFFSHPAPQGGLLVAIRYTFKNVSQMPVQADDQPAIHLLDASGTSYDEDEDATSDYNMQADNTQKIMSDLNPGITTTGTAVFEVSKGMFDPSKWHIYFGNDESDLFTFAP